MLTNTLETFCKRNGDSYKIFYSHNGVFTTPTCDEIFVTFNNCNSLRPNYFYSSSYLISIMYLCKSNGKTFATEFNLDDFEKSEQIIRPVPKNKLYSTKDIHSLFNNCVDVHSYTYIPSSFSSPYFVIFSEYNVTIYEYAIESIDNNYFKVTQSKYVITKNKIEEILNLCGQQQP